MNSIDIIYVSYSKRSSCCFSNMSLEWEKKRFKSINVFTFSEEKKHFVDIFASRSSLEHAPHVNAPYICIVESLGHAGNLPVKMKSSDWS